MFRPLAAAVGFRRLTRELIPAHRVTTATTTVTRKQVLSPSCQPPSPPPSSRIASPNVGSVANFAAATGTPGATTPDGRVLYPSRYRYDTGVAPADMPYLHHAGHDNKPRPKFKSPRKRASKLFDILKREKVLESEASNPPVWGIPFRVGDALELEVLESGGVKNSQSLKYDKIRGVVLGRENKGLDTAIYLKDVMFGEHVERKVKLHSPMVKSLKVLEKNFVFKGKRKVKRSKLYYLRDRNPEETRVTKW